MEKINAPDATEPNPVVVRVWTRLMRAQQIALASIEAALKGAGLPPLSWYDVLLELDRADEPGLRPFELERRMLLPQYGLSRLLDRVEAAGYCMRQPLAGDARGQRIVITQAGRALRGRMWPVYAEAIDNAVGARLTPDEQATLAEVLGNLAVAPASSPGGA